MVSSRKNCALVLMLLFSASCTVQEKDENQKVKDSSAESEDENIDAKESRSDENVSEEQVGSLAAFRITKEISESVEAKVVISTDLKGEELLAAIEAERAKLQKLADAADKKLEKLEDFVVLKSKEFEKFLAAYDKNGDGVIDAKELELLKDDMLAKIAAYKKAHSKNYSYQLSERCKIAREHAKRLGEDLKYFPLLKLFIARCDAADTPKPVDP